MKLGIWRGYKRTSLPAHSCSIDAKPAAKCCTARSSSIVGLHRLCDTNAVRKRRNDPHDVNTSLVIELPLPCNYPQAELRLPDSVAEK